MRLTIRTPSAQYAVANRLRGPPIQHRITDMPFLEFADPISPKRRQGAGRSGGSQTRVACQPPSALKVPILHPILSEAKH